jgi:iron-regulated transporter 1
VLPFTGYAYSQGLSEAVLGGLQAGGAILGIMGAFAYPRIRMCVGLERTGLFGLGAEILCLCLCVASIWTPGSPFNLLGSPNTPSPSVSNVTCSNATNAISLTTAVYNTSEPSVVTLPTILGVSTVVPCNETISSQPEVKPDISVWLLMAGIITARFGKEIYNNLMLVFHKMQLSVFTSSFSLLKIPVLDIVLKQKFV